ncbi:S41 family peptidase [Shewanella kaireitica]|uniref:S41 family peptidase n=1 Tax=Shewanella kaireitica TaxID=212021 RepID=UPI00200E1C3C|nr:S41 family peptidase [Shewanella kaireitica]MCL1092523.1 S41 family peptidase [Shewanella kaireitica]
MALSVKSIFFIFATMMLISAVQLIRISFFPHSASYQLTSEQQKQDIRQLLSDINQKSAFAALDPHRKQHFNLVSQRLLLANLPSTNSAIFKIRLQAWLSELNDPAVSVTLPNSAPRSTVLTSFKGVLHHDGKHWLAFMSKEELFDEDYPYLTHIDGLPMNRWVTAAQQYIPDSLKLSSIEQSRWISRINQLRLHIGLSLSDSAQFTFASSEGDSIQRTVKLAHSNDNTQQSALLGYKQPSSERQTLIYPANNKFKSHFFKQLESNTSNPIQLDLRQLTSIDNRLSQWINANVAPSYLPYDSAIGLIKYKRYPSSNAASFSRQAFSSLDELPFFEQTQLETVGFNSQFDNTQDFSQWLVRRTAKYAYVTSEKKQLHLLVDSSCQQECEWLTLRAANWPNVKVIGERTRGSLSPRHSVKLMQSGININYSAALTYSAQGRLISGVGVYPHIKRSGYALNYSNTSDMVATESKVSIRLLSGNKRTSTKRQP